MPRRARGRAGRDELGIEALRSGELLLRLGVLTEKPEHQTEVEVRWRVVRLDRDDPAVELRRFLVGTRDTSKDREIEERGGHPWILLDRRHLTRMLDDFEAQGITRRSQRGDGEKW